MEAMGTPELDPERERRCRERIDAHLRKLGQRNVEQNVEQLCSLLGFNDRFDYFCERAPELSRERLLVSGCAIGSEMLAATSYGFEQVVGTEVDPEYVSITRERLGDDPRFEALGYDGITLPFPDHSFTAVASGHIIEHTPSPHRYLGEHMRVLKPGHHLFLEFPNRYHGTELHTGVASVEWLPKLVRTPALYALASRFALRSPEARRCYEAIRTTLQPVSVWQIRMYLGSYGEHRGDVIHRYAPAPGFIRMIIRKRA